MALSSANAVSPTPVVDSTVKANASVAGGGNGGSGTFNDNLEAVLAQPGAAKTSTKMGSNSNVTPFASGKLAKLKSKLMNGDAGTATGNVTTTPGKAHILPVVNPPTGQISAVPTSTQTDASAANPALANTGNTPADAIAAATQAKLVASLVKTAKAPVLKAGQDDGSTVPNTKIAHPAKTESPADRETVQSMAAKIAATAAVSNPDDTTLTAAKSVAAAEVSARSATTTQSITKIEAAAMANATQAAVHAPTPQEKIEAQALPVQFDAQSSKQDADTQSGTDGKSQPGGTHTASDSPRKTDAPSANFVENTQPSTPAPSQASATPANTDAAATNAGATTSTTPSQVATTLQVSQQPQHSTSTDQATFAALGVAIAAKSKDGEKQFDINMHPADLGRVDVRISVDAQGKAQAHLSAEHPQTLQLLQNDKATLERNLRDAGLDVANNGLSFSLKGEQQSSSPTFNARNRALSIATVQAADISSTASSSSSAPGDSRLDIRV